MIVYLLVDDYPAWGDLSPLQVLAKPGSGKPCDFFERARFFKQMCRARNNLQFFLALKLRVSLLVQLDDHFVAPADDEQRRRLHPKQGRACEVGPLLFDSVWTISRPTMAGP